MRLRPARKFAGRLRISGGVRAFRKQNPFPWAFVSYFGCARGPVFSEHYSASVMLMALLIGMAFAFLAEDGLKTTAGIEFAAKKLLRFGVAPLGLGVTFKQINSLGVEVFALTIVAVVLINALGPVFSRVFRGANCRSRSLLTVLRHGLRQTASQWSPIRKNQWLADLSRWSLLTAIAALGTKNLIEKTG